MKKQIIQFSLILALLSGCSNPTSSKKNNTSSNTNPESTSHESPTASQTSNVNIGPTGDDDPVNYEDVETPGQVTNYDTPFQEEASPELPGSPIEVCGDMYKELNNDTVFLKTENTTYHIKKFSYESDIYLRTFNFPNDSVEICSSGYSTTENSTPTIYLNKIQESVAIDNPSLSFSGDYTYKICGDFSFYIDLAGNSLWQIRSESTSYFVENPNDLELPATPNPSVKACIYSNTNYYYDFSISYRRFFDAQAIDFGRLGQAN